MAIIHINDADCRKFYRLLGHKNCTELRFISPTRSARPVIRFVDSEDEFVAEIRNSRNYHGGLRQVYAGLHDRKRNGSRTEDIIGLGALLFDIDRIAELKKDAPCATETQVEVAKGLAKDVADYLTERYGIRAAIAMSGNGCHVLVRQPQYAINDKNRSQIAAQLKTFGISVCAHWNPTMRKSGFELDEKVFDLARICKVPGTLSVKGNVHRMTHFIEGPYPDSKADELLLNYILTLPAETLGAPKHRNDSRNNSAIAIPNATSEHCDYLLSKCRFMRQFVKRPLEDYDTWIGIGGSLRLLGPAGLSLWDKLSSNAANYDSSSLLDKWERGNLYVFGCERLGCAEACGVGMPINWVFQRFGSGNQARETTKQTVRLQVVREHLAHHLDMIFAEGVNQ